MLECNKYVYDLGALKLFQVKQQAKKCEIKQKNGSYLYALFYRCRMIFTNIFSTLIKKCIDLRKENQVFVQIFNARVLLLKS